MKVNMKKRGAHPTAAYFAHKDNKEKSQTSQIFSSVVFHAGERIINRCNQKRLNAYVPVLKNVSTDLSH